MTTTCTELMPRINNLFIPCFRILCKDTPFYLYIKKDKVSFEDLRVKIFISEWINMKNNSIILSVSQ